MATVQGSNNRGEYDIDESSLLAAAAGELSSPLVLLRQLSLMLSGDDIAPAERKRLADQLTLTSERALRLTGNIVFPTHTPRLIELEPVNAVSLCNDVVHELSPLFTAHGKNIVVPRRVRVPLLIANIELLRRLLVALGDNALHYSSDTQPVKLTITSRGDRVRVGVRDYGPAVPINTIKRLEERMKQRAAVIVPRRPQTSGVALLGASRLAEAMGGVMGMTRHQDGATFYVDLKVSGQMSML